MSDTAYIGPSDNPDDTSHLPVSGEYSSRVSRRDRTLSDMDNTHERAVAEDEAVTTSEEG